MHRTHLRSLWCLLLISATAALLLSACSSGDETDPGPPPPPKKPLMIDDLAATAGTATSVTLTWTSPALADKAAIRYDLRYLPFGSENDPWDTWVGAAPPTEDASSGQTHTHEVTGLTSGHAYVFRMTASTDGVEWSEASNLVVATAAPDFDTTPPAAITGVILNSSTGSSLNVVWPLTGDDGPYGLASGYQARYADAPITPETWGAATPVPGPIYASELPGMMETGITGLNPGQEYFVAVVGIDDHANESDLSNVVAATTAEWSTIYVNVEGTGDHPTIEDAINAAVAGDLILVGPGRYTWTNQATGDSLLGMINVPRDYTDFEVRSLAGAGATILDAELHGKVMSVTGGFSGEPGNYDYAGITIDGFTFTNGRALAVEPNPDEGWSGAGLNLHLSDTVVRNCIFTGNEATEGGGMWVGGQGDAVIENCLFENNRAVFGGGILLINSEPRITVRDCTFRGNHARTAGGGIFAYHVTATMENLLVVGNDSSDKGGGISVATLNPGCEVIRCTVADNQAPLGSAIRLTESDLRIESSLLAFNTGSAAFSSVVQSEPAIGCTLVFGHDQGNQLPFNHTDLGGNLELDPWFCDRVDYLLRDTSPCLPGSHPDGAECGGIGARGIGCGR
ncbi:MAG: right-handed parallel beta-helix repeat-containing protein [Candidatus Krumholzibacteriota bacterium]